MIKNRSFSFKDTHLSIYEWNDMLSGCASKNAPLWLEAVVWMKQEWPWVDNCCSWESDSWVGLSYCSLVFHTGLIFSITKKKKSCFKIQVGAIPSRKENVVKVKEAPRYSQGTAKSSECWSTSFQSKLGVGGVVVREEAGSQEGWYLPHYDLLAGEQA